MVITTTYTGSGWQKTTVFLSVVLKQEIAVIKVLNAKKCSVTIKRPLRCFLENKKNRAIGKKMAKDPKDTGTIDLFSKLQGDNHRQIIRTASAPQRDRQEPANNWEPEPPEDQIKLF